MDIRVSSAYNTYSMQPTKGSTQSQRTERSRTDADRVSLSAQAGDYQTARTAVANAPDIRTELVSGIQARLSAGTYNVSASAVASRILQMDA